MGEETVLSEDVHIHQERRLASRTYGEKAVVIVIDQQKIHQLNSVGTRVWELADGRQLRDIVDAMVCEFDVDRAVALADVRAFVAELHAIGAIKVN